jgi:hypothetical protein
MIAGDKSMTEIEEKVAEIKNVVNREELLRIEAKMREPGKIICPFNKRYWQLPLACIGYHYVCPHLDRMRIACDHPEKRRWKVSHVSPGVKVLTR